MTPICLKIADLLYKVGLSIHHIDINGNSLLHYYAFYHDNEGAILRWYLEKGGNINIRNGKGLTPLQEIVGSFKGQFACIPIEQLLKAGASCSEPTPEGDYLIHQAVNCKQSEYIGIIELILKYNKDLFFAKNSQRKTPLEIAIKSLDPNVVKAFSNFAMNNNLEITPSYQHLLLNELVNSIKNYVLGVWFFYDKLNDCITRNEGGIEFDLNRESDFVSIIVDVINQMTFKSKDVASLLNLPDELGNTFWHKLAYIYPELVSVLCEKLPEVGNVSSLSNNKGKSVLDLVIDGHNTLHLIKAIDKLNVEMVEIYLKIPTLNFHITDRNQNTLLHLAVTRDDYDKCYKIVKLILNDEVQSKHPKHP